MRLARSSRVLACLATSAVLATAAVAPASAQGEARSGARSAAGYVTFGAACIKSVCWPGGTWGHVVRGNGLVITRQEAEAQDLIGAGTAGKQFCNWKVDFIDYRGSTIVRNSQGPIHRGCYVGGVGRGATYTRTVASTTTKTCAVLYNNGADEVARQCHSIYP